MTVGGRNKHLKLVIHHFFPGIVQTAPLHIHEQHDTILRASCNIPAALIYNPGMQTRLGISILFAALVSATGLHQHPTTILRRTPILIHTGIHRKLIDHGAVFKRQSRTLRPYQIRPHVPIEVYRIRRRGNDTRHRPLGGIIIKRQIHLRTVNNDLNRIIRRALLIGNRHYIIPRNRRICRHNRRIVLPGNSCPGIFINCTGRPSQLTVPGIQDNRIAVTNDNPARRCSDMCLRIRHDFQINRVRRFRRIITQIRHFAVVISGIRHCQVIQYQYGCIRSEIHRRRPHFLPLITIYTRSFRLNAESSGFPFTDHRIAGNRTGFEMNGRFRISILRAAPVTIRRTYDHFHAGSDLRAFELSLRLIFGSYSRRLRNGQTTPDIYPTATRYQTIPRYPG